MHVPLELMRQIQSDDPRSTWNRIFDYAWEICSAPMTPSKAGSEVANRDRRLAGVDLFLTTAAWDLWSDYEAVVEHAADVVAGWWPGNQGGAVLILDGLSLREVPWILQGAEERGYTVHQARAAGAELPADSTPFARALGFGQRSALENNGAGNSHRLAGARTESLNLPWEDCKDHVGSENLWVLWHHWPDNRIHDLGGFGKGISALISDVRENLAGDGFWNLAERLTTGRRLVITSDHGYAVSGHFPDTSHKEQAGHLKRCFKGKRWTAESEEESPWVPPADIVLETRHGKNRFVLGRRKWKIQGGYPTLTHGGLSVLEVAVPFIEISRSGRG